MEGPLLLAVVVQKYEVTVSPMQSDEGKMTITMHPQCGLPVKIAARNS